MGRALTLFGAFIAVLLVGFYLTLEDTAGDDADIAVYLTPTCGCCSLWVDHLEEEGFEVEVHERDNLAPIRSENGVPPFLTSCHTAVAGGYVVEGHVPAEDIRRLLEEKPEAVGISVPGMPIGSPGMEVPGRQAEPYQVILFKEDGSREVFAQH